MNRHIIELTNDGAEPAVLLVDELDVIYFKNMMDEDTKVTVAKKGLLKPKGKIKVAAKSTSKRRTVKKHPSGAFDFSYTVSGMRPRDTRSGTIRV